MRYYSFMGPAQGATAIVSPHSTIWKTSAWTMALWIKIPADAYIHGVLSTSLTGNPTVAGVCWEVNARGLYVDLQNSQAPVADLTSPVWHPVAVTYDATDMRTYADGAPSGLVSVSGLGAMVWDTNLLTMAAFGASYSGLIALPQIYNRKLSGGEIATLASGGQVTAGLAARWQGTEGTGNTINEDVNGLHGVATDVVTWSTDIPSQLAGGPPGGGGITGKPGFKSPLIGNSSLLLRRNI